MLVAAGCVVLFVYDNKHFEKHFSFTARLPKLNVILVIKKGIVKQGSNLKAVHAYMPENKNVYRTV